MNAAQLCVSRGGLWDSFAMACNVGGQQQAVSPVAAFYPGYNYAIAPVAANANKSQATARSCVQRGGLWDSFSGACEARGGQAQVFQPYPTYVNYGYPIQGKQYFNPMTSPYSPVAPAMQNIPVGVEYQEQEDVFAFF